MQQEKKLILVILSIEDSSSQDTAHRRYLLNCIRSRLRSEIHFPLQISAINDTALFCYAIKEGGENQQETLESSLAEQLLALFHLFWEVQKKHAQRNQCNCEACRHINDLKLRIFLHSGKTLLFKEKNKSHFSGEIVSQIRALKTETLRSGEYIAMTAPTLKELVFADRIDVLLNEHSVLGETLQVYYHFPEKKFSPPTPACSRWKQWLESLQKLLFSCF